MYAHRSVYSRVTQNQPCQQSLNPSLDVPTQLLHDVRGVPPSLSNLSSFVCIKTIEFRDTLFEL